MGKRFITATEYLTLQKSTLGQRVRFFREETGKLSKEIDYSTRAVSNRLGVTPQSITAIERGESKNPSFQLIHGLSRELHVPIEALTDEYYQGDINLFEIGTIEEGEKLGDTTHDVLDPSLSSSFHLGCYVYQAFQDGRMRFVYSKETNNPVDYKAFIASLSRFISEIEMHSCKGDLMDVSSNSISPIVHAVSLFKAYLEHPGTFPLINKESWDQAFNEALTAFQQSAEGEREDD